MNTHPTLQTRECSPRLDGSTLVGRATVRAPGHCGELAQGMLGDSYFLITCPVDFCARVTVSLYAGGPGVAAPPGLEKAAAAVRLALDLLGRSDVAAQVTAQNPIPRSKGMGSSSADVTAAIAATGLALRRTLEPAVIGRLAVQVEPTDGVMFPGLALFDHRHATLGETLGSPPPMEIVALDFGGTVDTLEFNRVDRRAAWQAIAPASAEAVKMIREGVKRGDPALVGQGATISAEAAQKVSPKARLADVQAFAREVGAVGVNVAHSGTLIGVLLDARPRRGKSTFKKALSAFPKAESAHHFRLLGGGLRTVEQGFSSGA